MNLDDGYWRGWWLCKGTMEKGRSYSIRVGDVGSVRDRGDGIGIGLGENDQDEG